MANNVRQFKLTAEGLKQREEELEYLKSVKRRDIADKIKVALSFGDLSENSEYDEAKNEQAQVESRILELETMLKSVEIIDESELSTDVVKIGRMSRATRKKNTRSSVPRKRTRSEAAFRTNALWAEPFWASMLTNWWMSKLPAAC